MRKFSGPVLFVCALIAGLVVFVLTGTPDIKHYTADELVDLTCETLGDRHEEVIFAYHDAEIVHKKQTGAFHDDLGLPSEDVLPIPILMKHFMHDNEISITLGSSSSPLQRTTFYYEISSTCAANPLWQAVDAMRHAAVNLGLIEMGK